jgi:hypothetical protein
LFPHTVRLAAVHWTHLAGALEVSQTPSGVLPLTALVQSASAVHGWHWFWTHLAAAGSLQSLLVRHWTQLFTGAGLPSVVVLQTAPWGFWAQSVLVAHSTQWALAPPVQAGLPEIAEQSWLTWQAAQRPLVVSQRDLVASLAQSAPLMHSVHAPVALRHRLWTPNLPPHWSLELQPTQV